MWRLLRYLLGADVFISYARKDSGAYAGRLADRLKSEPGVSVYLDQDLSPVGRELPSLLLRHLKLSRRLVVIVSNAALISVPVQKEVEAFAETPRPVIPVDTLDGGDRPSWPGLHGAFWRTESADRVFAGTPSDEVIVEILDAIGADRQSRRTRRAAGVALLFVVTAAIASVIIGRNATRTIAEAGKSVVDAREETRRQRTLAAAATGAKTRADHDRAEAEEARRVALRDAAAASREATRQRQIAEATSIAGRAERLFQDDPKQIERVAFLATDAVRRFQDLGMRSVSADALLLDVMEQLGDVKRRIPYGRRATLARVSGEGSYVAAAHGETVELWDTTLSQSRVLAVDVREAVNASAVEFSGDERWVLVAFKGRDYRRMVIRIWRTADAKPLTPAFELDSGDVAISRDGLFYATWSQPGVVRVWSSTTNTAASPEIPHDLKASVGMNHELAFSPSSKYITAGGRPAGHLWTWSRDRFELAFSSKETCERWSFNDSETIAVASGAEHVSAYTVADGKPLWSANATRLSRAIVSIDGDRVAVAQAGGVDVRDLRDGNVISTFNMEWPLLVAMRGRSLVAASPQETSDLYDLLAPHAQPVRVGRPAAEADLAIQPGGDVVSAAYDDALVWRSAPIGAPAKLTSAGHFEYCAISPDSQFLATAEILSPAALNRMHVIDACSGAIVRTSEGFVGSPVAIAAGARYVAFSTAGGEVLLWDWRHEIGFHLLQPRQPGVDVIRFSPGGNALAASVGTNVVIWTLGDPTTPATTLSHSASVTALAFGASDRDLITSSVDDRLRVWRWTPGKGADVRAIPVKRSKDLAVLNDGRVATIDGDSVLVRDMRKRDAVVERIDHGEFVTFIASAPTGLLVTAGEDGLARLWRIRRHSAAEEIERIRVGPKTLPPHALALSPDGRILATEHDAIQLRRIAPQELLATACERLRAGMGSHPDFQHVCRVGPAPAPAKPSGAASIRRSRTAAPSL